VSWVSLYLQRVKGAFEGHIDGLGHLKPCIDGRYLQAYSWIPTNTSTMQTQTGIVNGHKVTIGSDGTFPFIQIDDSPKYFVDTDGDHWGSIGIDNPGDYVGTVLEPYITDENEDDDEKDEAFWTFDMGGMFCVIDENGRWNIVDEDEHILTPLGMVNNGEGSYGNG
jgi:hypothetical protein